jgi:hypothetical protein
MDGRFDDYAEAGPADDEMFDRGDLRAPYLRIRESLSDLTGPDLHDRVGRGGLVLAKSLTISWSVVSGNH